MKSMKQLGLAAFLAVALGSTAPGAEIRIGSAKAAPGETVTVPLILSAADPGLSAFAIYIKPSPFLISPGAATWAGQEGLAVFVDRFSSGVHRLTGVLTNGGMLQNGPVAALKLTVSGNAPLGMALPITVVKTPPDALPGPSPEFRTVDDSALIAGDGEDGTITIVAPPPVFGPVNITSNVITFTASALPNSVYLVHASTNLVDWAYVFAIQADGKGRLEWPDTNGTRLPMRFFRLTPPPQ